jgi:hypothetical protein
VVINTLSSGLYIGLSMTNLRVFFFFLNFKAHRPMKSAGLSVQGHKEIKEAADAT